MLAGTASCQQVGRTDLAVLGTTPLSIGVDTDRGQLGGNRGGRSCVFSVTKQ